MQYSPGRHCFQATAYIVHIVYNALLTPIPFLCLVTVCSSLKGQFECLLSQGSFTPQYRQNLL